MSVPPHLPPPVCNIKEHHNWQRLKLLGLAVFFGLLAGLTGASIMLGWIWPGLGGGDTWVSVQQNRTTLRNQLEEKIRLDLAERILTIYHDGDSGVSGNSGYIFTGKKIGQATIVSSDGWAAMYAGAYDSGYRNWRALASDGKNYAIGKAIFDNRSGLLFIKISASTNNPTVNQFKVATFVDDVRDLDEVYILEGNSWRYNWLGYSQYDFQTAAHLDTAPAQVFPLNANFSAGSLAINGAGRVVGLVVSGGRLLPANYLARLLPSILNQGKVVYSTLGVDGWFGEERPLFAGGDRVTGFWVNKVLAKNSALRHGDIIISINGAPVNAASYWAQIGSGGTLRLQVWRGGKTVDVQAGAVSI